MNFRLFGKLVMRPFIPWAFFLWAFLPILLATLFLLGSTRPLYAEDPTTVNVPHEIQWSAMLVVDLDGDGKQEIIAGSKDGYVTIVHGANYGILWDRNMADFMDGYDKTRIQSGLAAADLDGDGKIEIVVATGGADPINGEGPGALIVFTYVGGREVLKVKQGWPVYPSDELGASGGRPDGHPDGFTSTPSLGDIDGDGKMEIVIGGMDRRLHAFHHDGSYVLGWPLARDYGILRESRSTAALADLDGDGVLDILIGSNNYKIPNCANPYLFYGMKGNTTPLIGFPYETTQNIESSPALADLDNDGFLDIVFGTGDFNESCRAPGGQQSDGKKVYAINHLGQPLPGWPVSTNANMFNSPALGDLDNDGSPEVVIHTQDTLYAWHSDGTLVDGFPVKGEYNLRHASPVLADINGDSMVEIVLASGQIYKPNGELILKRNKLQSQLIITDQDGDGLLETVGANHFNYNFGWHLRIYIFHESGSATGAQPWPMFHRSLDRNGVLPTRYTLSGRIVDESDQGVPGVKVTLNSGEIAFTDQQGNYVFGTLRPGVYTATPSSGNNPFEPPQRSVTLSANAVLQPMVMHAPLYDIRGKVLHANNSPMSGIVVQLDTGATSTTGNDGIFAFDNQQPGEYTITPITPDLNYLPAERTVTAEDELPQFFYALREQIVNPLSPNSATQIEFQDTQGLPTYVIFPEGLGDDSAVITSLMVSEPNGFGFTGHALEITLASFGTSVQSGVVGEDGQTLEVEITIHYNAADLQTHLDEEELALFWLSPDGWVEAQTTCPSDSSVEHDLAYRTFTASVCQWGTYGLFAPIDRVFIPSVHSPE